MNNIPGPDTPIEGSARKPDADLLRGLCMLDRSGLSIFHAVRCDVPEPREVGTTVIVPETALPVLDAAAELR
ncbi:hypothetical protein ACFQ5Q_19055 [Luteolibacter ambystomatis]